MSRVQQFSPYLIALFAFLLYANTVQYAFTLDDKLYITHNRYVKKGISGIQEIWKTDLMEAYTASDVANQLSGGRYRPLSLSIHALEIELHDANPFYCHLLNAILYGLMTLLVYLFFKRVLNFCLNAHSAFIGALFASLLFAAHPLHIEVVANVSNRAELLASVLGLTSVLLWLKYGYKQRQVYNLLASVLLFLALLTKESAINYIPILVLLILVFKPKFPGTKAVYIKGILSLVLAISSFMILRYQATHQSEKPIGQQPNLLNQVYSKASKTEKAAGIVYCYGLGLSKAIIPLSLTHDYYPYHPFFDFEQIQNQGLNYPALHDWPVLLSGLTLIVLMAIGLILYFKGSTDIGQVIAFTIGVYISTTILYSNIFFEIGAFFNERFLFVASLAPCLLIGFLFAKGYAKKPMVIAAAFLLLLGYYSYTTISRSVDWQSDETLALADVKTSSGSARANLLAAEASLKLHRKGNASLALLHAGYADFVAQGVTYAKRALLIYPEYTAPLDILGNLYFENSQYQESIAAFTALWQAKPSNRVWNNMVFVLQEQALKNPTEAIKNTKALEPLTSNAAQKILLFENVAQKLLGNANTRKEGIVFLQQSIALGSTNPDTYNDLGTAYAIADELEEANKIYKLAFNKDIASQTIISNLILTFDHLNMKDSAAYYRKYVQN